MSRPYQDIIWHRYCPDQGSGTLSCAVPSGMQVVDYAIFGVATRNSSIGANPTGGRTWHEKFRYDTSSNEWHGLWWKRIDSVAEEEAAANWEITQSGTGYAAVLVFRPRYPVRPPTSMITGPVDGGAEVHEQKRWYSSTTPRFHAPAGAVCIDIWVQSYGVGTPVYTGSGWLLGTGRQDADEGVTYGWRQSEPGGLHPETTPEWGVSTSSYSACYTFMFPPYDGRGQQSETPDVELR